MKSRKKINGKNSDEIEKNKKQNIDGIEKK